MAELFANSGDLDQVPYNVSALFANYIFWGLETKMGSLEHSG